MQIKLDYQTILLALVVLTALAILLQTLILLAILISVRKTARALQKDAADLRAAVLPFIHDSREVFSRVAPKVESLATNSLQLIYGLRAQLAEVQYTTTEIVERVRIQTERLDSMLTRALDAVDRAGSYMAEAVLKPVRQVTGVLASVRAIVDSLRSPAPAPGQTRSASDQDRLV
ncbi:MAG TPA: hypothetical protein VKG86_02455 [Terracidiphilus sp.]|nr:hypothetical protein [Terracidiphilus sp.]